MKRHDKIALVTGAARGIGQAFAERLAQDGATVVAIDLARSDDTVARITQGGGRAVAHVADVSSPADTERVKNAVLDEFGRLDILVNNAGWATSDTMHSLSFDIWKKMFGINVDSVFLYAQAFAPVMAQRGWGRIVNMCSNTLGLNSPVAPHYVASKGAVLGLTRSLASTYGDQGITVNAISPGLTRTPGTEDLMSHEGVGQMVGAGADTPPDMFDMFAKLQAIKRSGRPSDLCGAMSFFASDDAAFITGQNLIVDGGLLRAI